MPTISEYFNDHMTELVIVGLVLFILAVIITTTVLNFILMLDCDLTTYAFSKYGPSPDKYLSGKVIWISGSCSGIGEQLAYDFSSKIPGCKLILSGNLSTLDTIKEQCLKGSKGRMKAQDILTLPPFDIRDTKIHESMVKKVIEHFRRIDILVNNVGRTQRAKFTEISPEEDAEIFGINVFGQISLSRHVMKVFEEQGSGHFVITSSVAGKFGAPFSASYTASKHALQGYFETVRCEGWSKGIRVTTICPGPVMTPLIERSFHSDTFIDEVESSAQLKEGKLEVTRCTELMLVAISNCLQESWISLKPILWFCFTCQYFPDLSKYIMVRFLPPDRLYKMRKGTRDQNQNIIPETKQN
jgi:dehydrogenase/reductase SDR family protein 7